MNIVVLTTHYPNQEYSNSQTAECHYFARSWVKAGHAVVVFHVRPTFITRNIAFQGEPYVMDGVRVFPIRCSRLIPRSITLTGRAVRIASRQILHIMKSEIEQPNLYYVDFPSDIWPIVCQVKSMLPAKVFPVFHNTETINYPKHVRDVVKDCSVIGVRSTSIEARIRDIVSDDFEYSCILAQSGSPPLDRETEAAVEKKLAHDARRSILYAGALIPLKNIHTIIEGLQKLGNSSLRLSIIGEGPERGRLESLVKHYQMDSQVSFLGKLPREDVLRYMSESDCFVMVSSPETFGLVYVEAMACGCFIIGSKGEGIDGVIVNGKNGVLVTPGDADELAFAINRFTQLSAVEYSAIVRQAMKDSELYGEDSVGQKLIDSILELIS